MAWDRVSHAIERTRSREHLEAVIHVASYNIRRGLGTDWRRSLERNLAVLREIDADVIAVQESDPVLADHLAGMSPEAIEEETDHVAVPLGPAASDIAWRGNMVLVRRSTTVDDAACVALPSQQEPRGAAVVDVTLNGTSLRVVAMHLGLMGRWRKRQAVALLDHVKGLERRLPTVMLGDINEWMTNGASVGHFAEHHRVLAPGRSFHSRLRFAALDRIIHSADLNVVSAGVHESTLARVASDHLPIWARLSPVVGANAS
jgi:endonuclease/exonuclease/phosphatase family metal-dependent hydrolase